MSDPFQDINIIKANGEKAAFSMDKLRHSIERSGAAAETVDSIVDQVKKQLYNGISTRKIYQLAFSLLKKHSKIYAGRYNIKRAIMDLGPSGFPFEKYVAEILKFQGYITEVNQIVAGHCVVHEIDVIAEKEQLRCIVECKFHNKQGISCDVKTPLYIHSRFKDVEQFLLDTDNTKGLKYEGWVVTNTKFTSDAIQYGSCVGLKLLGWNYPQRNNLLGWIETSGLYPVTCLTTLTKTEKEELLSSGTVLCRQLSEKEYLLRRLGITEKRIKGIIKESSNLSHPFDKNQMIS